MKFTILIIFNIQVTGCYYNIVLQPPSVSISRNFPSSNTETVYPLNTNSTSPSPTPLLKGAIVLISVSMNLVTLGTSYNWNHIVFVLCCIAYFALHGVFKVYTYCCYTVLCAWSLSAMLLWCW